MNAVTSAVRRTALFLFALLMLPLCAKGEKATMSHIPVTLQTSLKKANENNPLYTQRFGADPGVMEYNGRLYVYMTDDILEYGANGKVKENSYSQIRTINCISSDDLVNWTDHGRIRVAGPSGAAKWAANSWAPCASHKTVNGQEKFFLYFCNGGNGIGVLTADSPDRPLAG
nr:arabinofuranohydrolase [uncultured bacterium]